MKVLIDTNVLVAAIRTDHDHHKRALPVLSKAKRGQIQLVLSAHSIAESYAILTRYPRMPIPPAAINRIIQTELAAYTEIIALSHASYLNLVSNLSARGLTGGIVYDAIIVEVAKLANADQLLTFNIKHLLRIWPEGSNVIQEP